MIAIDEWRRYGWMMPACIVGVLLVAIHNYTLGVMIRPLEQEFGYEAATTNSSAALPEPKVLRTDGSFSRTWPRVCGRRLRSAPHCSF